MKFAKELEQDLVPEWRVKYLDYRAGKKRVKAVTRAATRVNTPRPVTEPQKSPSPFPSRYGATSTVIQRSRPSPARLGDNQVDGPVTPLRTSPAPIATDSRPTSYDSVQETSHKTPPMPILQKANTPEALEGMYGSFVPTPPSRDRAGTLNLPDPAVNPEDRLSMVGDHTMVGDQHTADSTQTGYDRIANPSAPSHRRLSDSAHDAYQVGQNKSPSTKRPFQSLRARMTHRGDGPPLFRRLFSHQTPHSNVHSQRADMDMVAVDQVRMRQREFFTWLDRELKKVESFYKLKEDEAGARLEVLRDQLHEMRNRRIEEVAEMESARHHGRFDDNKDDDERPGSRDRLNAWFDPIERVVGDAAAKTMAKINRPGANTKALQGMAVTPELRAKAQENGRDYVRRPQYGSSVPYRTAKHKLKSALKEHYRSMELLKSYALTNRVAFRKINKKYDKAIDAQPPLRYMSEKVNKSWFVQSDVLDSHMHATEDLYARYFEKGNRKVATGKLRGGLGKQRDQSGSAFKNGMLIGIGSVFTIQGLVYGAEKLYSKDVIIAEQTSYLLQIYGGYFLGLYLFSWFCLDCAIWTKNKINYQFVFEYDTRHSLDWRELSEFPSFLILLLGLFMWLNFSPTSTSPDMYIYFPVLLVGITMVIICFPFKRFYYKSRMWFWYSLWRLFFAGIYPVEFRDFFIGDMFCSLTYLMSNIALFACLYRFEWQNPSQCNSSHLRVVIFFSTLPSIWRAVQCVRRYADTRNIFPHLVNCGKYVMSIVYYVTLGIYRLDRTRTNLAVFITFATINAIYSSLWDLFMDWSLLQSDAKKPFLRDVRGYKNPNYYYAAMVFDVLLRFNWVFYAIFIGDVQHSTIVSFLVAFSEVTRRGIWVIFRVENEHCSNVAHIKASRDVPLPYELPSELNAEANVTSAEEVIEGASGSTTARQDSPAISRMRSHTLNALEAQSSAGSSTLRRRAGVGTPSIKRNLTKLVADAHMQDFEKKKRPGVNSKASSNNLNGKAPEDDQDNELPGSMSSSDDSDPEEDLQDAHRLLRERARDGNGNAASGPS